MLLADVALRSALILLAAWIATHALRRAAASTRHLVWTLAMIAVLALPVLMLALPSWQILPGVAGGPEGPPYNDLVAQPFGAAEIVEPPIVVGRPFRAAATSPAGSFGRAKALPYTVWLLIALPLLLRVPIGIIAVGRLARRAHPAGPRWRALFDDAVSGTATERPIRLLVSHEIAIPMTWGGARAVLLLPENSREWSDDRCRVVLLHELAHILRADWLSHTLGRVVVAAHWFNPLAWIAMRAMTRERERACDDYVLARGAHPTDYAQHLLEIARADRHGPAWVIAPAMARRSELEGRLLSILTRHRLEAGRAAGRSITLAAVIATAAIASASPAAPDQPARKEAAPRPPAVATTPGIHDTDEDRVAPRKAVKELADALQSESRNVREEAAMGLALAQSPSAIEPLIRALEDPDADVREKAALGLGFRSDSTVVDPLLAALGDESAQVREKAAMGLAFRKSPHVVDALIKAAGDPDSQVREKAVLALGLSGDARATAAIVEATKDPDPQVREKAIAALTMLGDESGIISGAVRGAVGVLFGSGRTR